MGNVSDVFGVLKLLKVVTFHDILAFEPTEMATIHALIKTFDSTLSR